jgi:signal peptidase II
VESKIENQASRPRRVLAYRWLWMFAGSAFVLDQLSKAWVDARLPLGSYGVNGITVIRGFFNIVHVGNTGAAWSMFAGKSTLLAGLAVVTLAAIFIWRRQLGLRQPAAQVCFGLLCGGTAGNLADRLVHGQVIDFLDFHFGRYIYPTFNIADASICVGVFGYVLWSLRQPAPP